MLRLCLPKLIQFNYYALQVHIRLRIPFKGPVETKCCQLITVSGFRRRLARSWHCTAASFSSLACPTTTNNQLNGRKLFWQLWLGFGRNAGCWLLTTVACLLRTKIKIFGQWNYKRCLLHLDMPCPSILAFGFVPELLPIMFVVYSTIGNVFSLMGNRSNNTIKCALLLHCLCI